MMAPGVGQCPHPKPRRGAVSGWVLCQFLRPAAHQAVKRRLWRPSKPPRRAGAPNLRAKTLEGARERKAGVHGLLPLRFLLRNLRLSLARDR